jgi:hypothetical protein
MMIIETGSSQYINVVLEELKHRMPDKIIVNSLRLLLNPSIFESEYASIKYDTDKYFMHLSNTNSEERIHELTVEMHGGDATEELELISARVLLALQEFLNLEPSKAAKIEHLDQSEWLKYFYYNQGDISEKFD